MIIGSSCNLLKDVLIVRMTTLMHVILTWVCSIGHAIIINVFILLQGYNFPNKYIATQGKWNDLLIKTDHYNLMIFCWFILHCPLRSSFKDTDWFLANNLAGACTHHCHGNQFKGVRQSEVPAVLAWCWISALWTVCCHKHWSTSVYWLYHTADAGWGQWVIELFDCTGACIIRHL